MPTIKPRVAVTLEPGTHEVIERLSVLQGRTRGAVIAELLDSVAPVLARTVSLLEAASSASEQVKQGLRSVAEGIHGDLLKTSGDSLSQLDLLLDQMRKTPLPAGANPHVVTRGSGTGVEEGKLQRRKSRTPVNTGLPEADGVKKSSGVKDARQKR
jgi:hypothetical protein